MGARTSKRSRSGAQEKCPHCGKQLRGAKGLKMHIAEAHPAPDRSIDDRLLASVASAIGEANR
ncbi:MAG TPA: hypothetical protein VGN79_12175 [Devosia sp.]|jgi:hypothetical protein|nr:hypothetical protein [Devosia sp.]